MNKLPPGSLLAALALLTVASYGQTVINSVPFSITQPGKYILKSDLTLRPGRIAAISVEASDVNINLNQFSLIGSTNVGATAGIGITAFGVHDLTVRNGFVEDFLIGVSIDSSSMIEFDNVHLVANRGAAARLSSCTDSVIRNCAINKVVPSLNPRSSVGIEISGGTGIQVINALIAGTATEPYVFGIGVGGNSRGNYFESVYIVNCETALKLQPEDKYRAITTTLCPGGIQGGRDVDGQSN
jgi:hypothetical protein